MSVGNVGQLTVDLLVSTMHMEKVGYLSTDAVYPVVGNDPFRAPGPSGKCELVTATEGMFSTKQCLYDLIKRLHILTG